MKVQTVSPLIAVICLSGVGAQEVPWQGQQVLTNAAQVLALPAERAIQGLPVAVRGVVTAAERYWEGRFFLQDDSGGVFVDNISTAQPGPGDLVEVSGVSHPGAFAPVISQPHWKIVGTAPLPPARPVSFEALLSGREDSQRVEIRGSVRAASEEHGLLSVDLVSEGYRSHVFAKLSPNTDPQSLIGSTIRVRGTAAASFNAQLRQLINTKVFAPLSEDFTIEKRELRNPFEKPILPLAGIAQYRRDSEPGTRIHVKGTITYQQFGENVFLMDKTGGLRLQTRAREHFVPGEVVEAAGFAALDHFLPVLEDAILRRIDEPPKTLTARRASTAELQAGLHHASLVRLTVRLLDRDVRRSMDRANEAMQVQTTLMLQGDNLIFPAEREGVAESPELMAVPLGSMIEISGVCLSEIDAEGKLKLLTLLLPAGQPLVVLQTPGWLTPRRLSVTLGVLFCVLLLAVSWTVVISKKNSTLKVTVREKEQAKQELKVAHDQLEVHVKERTEQLNQQISARRESELQFKVVLRERTRLAQELHDTLEQTLTGIALQMDTATKLVGEMPEEAENHLRLARCLVGQGQVDVRRSVWDLRSRALEQFDLPAVVSACSRQLTDGTCVEVKVSVNGSVRRLPDVIEDNLLRIAQEALTNAIKHSGGTTANISLDYQPRKIVLEIRDNGQGFAADQCDGPLNGHFGLLGISERVKRLNGQVTIESLPASGTTVRVEIPLEPEEIQLPVLAGRNL